MLQKKRQRTSYCQWLWRIGNKPHAAPSNLQIAPLPRQKPRFLLKFCEIQGSRSRVSCSPEPVGMQLGTPWLGDRGSAGRASAHPSPPRLLSRAKLKHTPSKAQGLLPSPLYHCFSMQKMNHHATKRRLRLQKGGHSQPLGSQWQNVRVGCSSYSFGQSYYHHTAEKLPRVAVMLKPNLHIIQCTRTRGVDAAWKKVHPLQHLSLADAQTRSLLQQEPDGGGPQPDIPDKGIGLVSHGD